MSWESDRFKFFQKMIMIILFVFTLIVLYIGSIALIYIDTIRDQNNSALLQKEIGVKNEK